MDFLSTRPMEIMKLALDGLETRNKVLASNIANAESPGYQRVDVVFEDQLAKILKEDDMKQASRFNSAGLMYTPSSLDSQNISSNSGDGEINTCSDFKPELVTDGRPALKANGNNVNMEQEMAELSKNGTRYTILADLEGRIFRGLQDIIKGAM